MLSKAIMLFKDTIIMPNGRKEMKYPNFITLLRLLESFIQMNRIEAFILILPEITMIYIG
jgi:hypothetical protein